MKTPDIEPILDSWLGEGTDVLPDRSIEAVLRTVEHTSQRRALRLPWRNETMDGRSPWALVAGTALVVALVVGGLFFVGGSRAPSVGGGVSHAPSLTPTPAPSPSPAPSMALDLTGRIVFVSDRAGPRRTDFDIWVMNADGSARMRLTATASPESFPAWSPDGRQIAFVRGDSEAEIWVMDADGSNQRQLSQGGFWIDGRPSWSPDGSRIAFADSHDGGLYTLNTDGSGQTRITTDVGDHDPAWSPDGGLIAFANGGSVFTVRPDGSGRVPYALRIDPARRLNGLAWAPGGSQLAVTIADSDAIWLENGIGGTNLTIGAGLGTAGWPSWSSDGRRLTFTARTGVPTDGGSVINGSELGDIYMINADGTGLVNLTNDVATDYGADWSWAPARP